MSPMGEERTPYALPYRGEIDGLRAIAVIAVVLFHAFSGLLPGGFAGVDIFFVISGYLITSILLAELETSGLSLLTFYARRARRLLPALLLVLTVCTALSWGFLYPAEIKAYGRSLVYGAAFLANIGDINRFGGYFGAYAAHPVLLHLWSLGVEEQFYFVWPIMLLLACRIARWSVPWVLGLGVLGSLALSGYLCPRYPENGFYEPYVRAWEVGLGALLSVAEREFAKDLLRRARASFSSMLAVAGLALIVGSLLWLSPSLAIPGLWVLPPTLGALLIIAAGPRALTNRRLLSAQPVRWVGQISYALYLWHWPLLLFLGLLEPGGRSPLGVCVALLATVLLSGATYHLIEKPIRRIPARSALVLGLVVGLACFALLGEALRVGLLRGRLYSPAIAVLEQAEDDWHYPGKANFGRARDFTATDTLAKPTRPGVTVFMGDSHMEQYWPRAERLTEEGRPETRRARFITYGGCPLLPGLNEKSPRFHCDAFLRYAFAQAGAADVDTVVLSAYWEDYFYGEYGRGPATVIPLVPDDEPKHPALHWDSPETIRAFAALEAEIDELRAQGKRVFIVLSSPSSPRFDPSWRFPARLSADPTRLAHSPQEARLARADFAHFVAPIRRRLTDMASRSGAIIIDPASVLCGPTTCLGSNRDGSPLYKDSDHLNAHSAARLATFIDQTLVGP